MARQGLGICTTFLVVSGLVPSPAARVYKHESLRDLCVYAPVHVTLLHIMKVKV